MGMRPSQTSIASFFAAVHCCKSKSLSKPTHPTTSLNLSHSLLLKVNKVKGLAGPFTGADPGFQRRECVLKTRYIHKKQLLPDSEDFK